MARRFRVPPWAPWGLTVAAAVALPVLLLNLAVAFFGNNVIFPLSPFHLGSKLHALGRYFAHRPLCLFLGHPEPHGLIASAEKRHHLPGGLLEALLEVESGTRPHRISSTGAMGMGQMVPSTAKLLGVDDPFDTPQAVEASARYLSEQLVHFHSVPLAVAAYNAGPGNVQGHVPHNGETEFYVARVTAGYARLRAARHVPINRKWTPSPLSY